MESQQTEKHQRFTNWIQAVCAILLVIAAFWALFSWKGEKEYEVEVLASSWAERHHETFFNIYGTIQMDTALKAKVDEIRPLLDENPKIEEDFPNIIEALIMHRSYKHNRRIYQSEYDKMVDHVNLVLKTFEDQGCNKSLYCFYKGLYNYNSRRVNLFRSFETNFFMISNDIKISKVKRDEVYKDLEKLIESILKSNDDLIEELTNLKTLLTGFNSEFNEFYLSE